MIDTNELQHFVLFVLYPYTKRHHLLKRWGFGCPGYWMGVGHPQLNHGLRSICWGNKRRGKKGISPWDNLWISHFFTRGKEIKSKPTHIHEYVIQHQVIHALGGVLLIWNGPRSFPEVANFSKTYLGIVLLFKCQQSPWEKAQHPSINPSIHYQLTAPWAQLVGLSATEEERPRSQSLELGRSLQDLKPLARISLSLKGYTRIGVVIGKKW